MEDNIDLNLLISKLVEECNALRLANQELENKLKADVIQRINQNHAQLENEVQVKITNLQLKIIAKNHFIEEINDKISKEIEKKDKLQIELDGNRENDVIFI
jgi:predicted transcriptional regulator